MTRFASLLRALVILACLLPMGTSMAQETGTGDANGATAPKRLALIIANSAYSGDLGELPNPVNDGKLIADAMTKVGFTVAFVSDVDQKAMKRAIGEFGEALAAAGPETVGLFYYAGHGLQVGGTNYLVPIGAQLKREADADLEAVEADTVLKQMEFAGTRINIVVLDACRNNPLARSVRSASRGLARMDAPTGSFIAYSTAPGDVAADGSGANSPFASALATEITAPNQSIEEVFRRVRVEVKTATNDGQVPWDSSSLTDAFVFNPTPVKAVETADGASVEEKDLWQSVENTQNPAELEVFLKKFPNGTYAELAQVKLDGMRGGTTQVASRDSGSTAARKYDYADAALVKLPREMRPTQELVKALRETTPFQSLPEPGRFHAELTYAFADGERKQTESYDSVQAVDGLAAVTRKITYVTPWNNVADAYKSETEEQSIAAGPVVLGHIGNGTETAPGKSDPIYYDGRLATVAKAEGSLFPIGDGTHIELSYAWETQSGQPVNMTLSSQVTGSMACSQVNAQLTGTCYVLESTSQYEGSADVGFWTTVFSEDESAFIPWGDFGTNDTVLGTIAVTAFSR